MNPVIASALTEARDIPRPLAHRAPLPPRRATRRKYSGRQVTEQVDR